MSDNILDIQEIMKVLPHRYPFLLVDRITALEPGSSIQGIKNVTMNEPFFPGHFPAEPIMPGVLTIEAMAQVAAILARKSVDEKAEGPPMAVYFMSIEKAKFRKPVRPGDVMVMDVEVIHKRDKVWKVSGKAKVDGSVVSEGEFTAMLAKEEQDK